MSVNGQKTHTHTHTHTANPLKRPRQEPVSCHFCRSKKLKCNRQRPCSNCTARGLACNGNGQAQPASVDVNHDSILTRLKRLEDMVLGPGPSQLQHGLSVLNQTSQPSPLLTQSRPTPSPMACLSPASEYEEAVQSLENMGAREEPWFSPSSGGAGPDFRISPTRQIPDAYGVGQTQAAHGQQDSRCFFLPPKEEADLLMDHYTSYIDALQHVIYIPHVRTLMASVYSQLEQGLPAVHSHIALVLSIFASSAVLIAGNAGGGGLQHRFEPSAAYQASKIWANATLEVLDLCRRRASGSLEDAQASIIIGFLLYHMEGFSVRVRFLFTGAVAVARDLCLHRIDMPSNQPSHSSNPIHTEIKRRVWWHIVATDWLLSLNGGPQEGTYLVQPRHMRVNLPRNVEDEDLVHDDPPIDRPLSEPTTMSYYIQRLKLADICRSVVDVMPLCSFLIDYQDVIALDRKFEDFFDNLPIFLKTDDKSRLESEAIMRKHPHMRIQRYILGTMGLIRRCKLHQPFLIRRPTEGHYNYSRNVSLQCARSVLGLKRLLDAEHVSTLNATIRPGVLAYPIFMATIVLVMDLCFNRNEGDDAARNAEVRDACKALEDCLSPSQPHVAHDTLNSLMDTLRKHKVKLHNPPGDTVQKAPGPESVAMPQPPKEELPSTRHVSNGPPNPQSRLYDNPQNVLSDFDEIWKQYVEYGPNMDMPDWDSLFNDLDSRLF
ncbi:hypothetical protein A1O3_05827 [Capronia epimyces CBS 606.96]|uniref:Zn(2)-C6 fungal-type domain-containing protein n=1 Tax=Capronia epimyces CBS 606.96 TaxID=1182542 RepID=W9XX51_9EURO|nr:uncharacterized protein A1O3_05827 [Capronia epimyces CBS 606.96]EXJ85152.1 hypothetical protein A1O3_05827 [Capronia epimyces CBS 606.96]